MIHGMEETKLCEDGRIKDANKLLNEMTEKKVVHDKSLVTR